MANLGVCKPSKISEMIEKNLAELNDSKSLNEILQLKKKASNLYDKKDKEKYQKGISFQN